MNTLIKTNVLVSEDIDILFIEDAGTNTKLKYNYYGIISPCFIIEIISQSFSKTEFIVIVNISSECVGLKVRDFSIQMWWNGIILPKNSIINLGNGVYNISLTPILIEHGEDPILLNMTISEEYYRNKYFETYIAVDPESVEKGSEPSFILLSCDDDDRKSEKLKETIDPILIIAIIGVGSAIAAIGVAIILIKKRKFPKRKI
jgi:hypothetical protein